MPDPSYVNFILNAALKAIDGDEGAKKMFARREYRAGIEACMAELQEEVRSGRQRKANDFEDVIHLIVSATKESRDDAMRLLRQFMRGSSQIDIVDPYLLSKRKEWETDDIERFACDFVSILPKGATVNLFTNGYAKEVRSTLWKKLKQGRVARLIQSDSYHDRFIVTDTGIKLMGASFNGLGRSVSALIDLNEKDCEEVRASVLRERMTGRKIAGPSF